MEVKTGFAFDQGLAGVMVWSIDTDDFRGICTGVKYPLLRTLNKALVERELGLHGDRDSGGALASRSPAGILGLVLGVLACKNRY